MTEFKQLAQILYEISMSIGTSLELNQMLRTVSDVTLRKLNGSAYVVFKKNSEHKPGFNPMFTSPQTFLKSDTYSYLQNLIVNKSDSMLADYPDGSPFLEVSLKEKGCLYLMDLPDFGLLVLYLAAGALPTEVLQAMGSLNQKLAVACKACLAHEHLEQQVADRTSDLDRSNLEMMRVMSALQASENQFRSLFKHAPIPLCYVNASGELEKRNNAFLKVIGYTQEDARTLDDWWPLAYPDEDYRKWVLETWGAAVEEAASSGQPIQPAEYNVTCKDGTVRTMEIFGIMIGDDFLATFVDLTDRVHAELLLEQKLEELAKSNSMLEQFAYVASHDLQEPLRMVTSYLQLLKRRYEDKLDDNARQFIEFATDGADRMKGLIQDLLVFSRVGTQGKEMNSVSLEDVLKETLFNLSMALEESGGEVTHDPLPTIYADDTQMAQVLQNLISNALKFHGNEAPRIHVGAKLNGDRWLISVSDNGIGIEDQYCEGIFEIFQRLHNRDTYPGTGIGLAIVKKIVERHGGRIWVESLPEQGSTFHFTLTKSP